MQQACDTGLMHLVLVQTHAACQTNHQRAHRNAVHIGVVVRSLQSRQADQGMGVALDRLGHLVDQQA
ncbi:hypothetical protein SDC9_149356 [bioreactor metagenome]|uniref:Uncharacterized protein n=1 Tax=bioreactor metagenome TaxID=1076179 RepID=A0A645ENM0_9ZZZZ